MRQLNSTTLGVGVAILMGSSPLCLTLMYRWGYPVLGSIAAIALIFLAGLLFLFGWVLPRMLGGRAGDSPNQDGAVATNRVRKFKAEANLTKKSDGGIELNAGVSTTAGEVADDEAEDDDEEPGGT
jgi:hypothetical protein